MVQFNSGYASQDALYISTVTLTVLAGVIVGARLITRTIFAHQTGLDDVLVTVAYVFSVIMGISIWKQTEWGMGKHITDITYSEYTQVALWFWLCYWIYYLALFFTKASILVQYLRVFPHDKLRYLSFALLAVVGAWSIWAVFSGIFMCRPVSIFWTATTLNPPQCLSRENVFYANAAVNMATDIATFLLPLPYVYSLEIPRKQKALLMCVFGLGFFVVLTSVFRLIWIYPVTISPDITWNNPMINIWSCAEVNTGILCSCAPAMKGMIQRVFPKLLESMRSVTGKSFSFSSASRSGSETPDGKRRQFGSFVSSKLSSNKSGSRSFNRSYGGEEPLENEKAIEVRTSVVTELERNDGSEFGGRDEYGRDDRTLQGKTETMISSAGGR